MVENKQKINTCLVTNKHGCQVRKQLPAFVRQRAFIGSFVLLLIFALGLRVSAQRYDSLRATQQATFTCDNNFLLFNGEDGYYTNGIFFQFDQLRKRPAAKTVKQFFAYEIGQKMYTAHTRKILPKANTNFPGGISEIDRPIAGYLFGKVSLTSFFSQNQILSVGVSIGTTGKGSFGKEAYTFWHRMIGVKDYWNWIWDYQIKDELGVNVHGTWAMSLFQSDASRFVQITPVTTATLGTTFTNVTQGMLVQVGKLRPMQSSSYWHSRLHASADNDVGGKEFFFHYKPMIHYQAYNATIQGGIFQNDKGPIVADPATWIVAHEVGLRFSTPLYCVAYLATFMGKEARTQFHRQAYGSLVVTVRFR